MVLKAVATPGAMPSLSLWTFCSDNACRSAFTIESLSFLVLTLCNPSTRRSISACQFGGIALSNETKPMPSRKCRRCSSVAFDHARVESPVAGLVGFFLDAGSSDLLSPAINLRAPRRLKSATRCRFASISKRWRPRAYRAAPYGR